MISFGITINRFSIYLIQSKLLTELAIDLISGIVIVLGATGLYWLFRR
ncbi:hypothetical protein [Noviherbaspirillum cavernae]|nr:hypothetical protein [Noviherbaspirillum cavernae]